MCGTGDGAKASKSVNGCYETSLKWLTVAMPLLKTIERLLRDWRETGERLEGSLP